MVRAEMKECQISSKPVGTPRALSRSTTVIAWALALVPVTASANVGTPLFWATTFHLFIGNAILGALEGLLLHKLFKTPAGRSISGMILANYVSAGIGTLLLADDRIIRLLLPDVSIVNLRSSMALIALGIFVLTLVIELPFIWYCLRGTQAALRRALGADFAIHLVTCPLIFFAFWNVSRTSFATSTTVVEVSSLMPTEVFDLFYLAPDGSRVMKIRLGSTRQETLKEVSAPGRNDRLYAIRDAQGKFDLGIHIENDDGQHLETNEIIVRDFAGQASLDSNIEQRFTDRPNGTWTNHGPASKLAKTSDWQYTTGFLHSQGLIGKNIKDGSSVRFALETILFQWETRTATHLPGDTVVFQLGEDQICLMHPPTRRIALLARGKGPVIAKPKP